MTIREKIKEKFQGKFTITVKPLEGDEFDMNSDMFEAFCVGIVRLVSEDSTYISNDALNDLSRSLTSIKVTNCSEVWDGIHRDMENSRYLAFIDHMLDSVSNIMKEYRYL